MNAPNVEWDDVAALIIICLILVVMGQTLALAHFAKLLREIAALMDLFCHPVVTVRIVLENTMTSVVEGGSLKFEVQGFNKAGKQVPLTDASAAFDNAAVGSATVGVDGTGGDFSAVAAGAGLLSATAAGIAAEPLSITVTADVAVATVKIVELVP